MSATDKEEKGALHPISQTIRELTAICQAAGFSVAQGPELETEFYNFDALNVPKDHPARDMQDTFWVKENAIDGQRRLLRTHTSPVQVRLLEQLKAVHGAQLPSLRAVIPGKVFRNEATDATHDVQFHQLEGLVVDPEASIATLKGTVEHFLRSLFGREVKMRFRPSFFPFTEPSLEIDIFTGGRWMEIMGAGMVHPSVFRSVGLDPATHKGFAFGIGIDRLVLHKYGITDVRMLYGGDPRIVAQFELK